MWTFTLALGMVAGLDLPPTIDDLSTIQAAGDTNGDGICDVLVADRDGAGAERVRIVSGSDGSLLRELRGRKPGDWFGFSMACVGDLDGDAVPDIAVGARGGESIAKEGDLVLGRIRQDEREAYVRVFSGRDGRVLHEFQGDFICGRAGDFDSDGKADLLLGGRRHQLGAATSSVEVRSIAKSRSLLHLTPPADEPDPSFGAASCVLPDLDGDAIPEVVVCSPGWSGDQGRVSRIVLASGRLGAPINTAKGDRPENAFGWTLVVAGDLDADGRPDLLVTAPKRFVKALSGDSLESLYIVACDYPTIEGFASSLDVVPDVDGDRVPDFVVGCDESPDFFDGGFANLYSGKDGRKLRSLFDSPTEGVEVCTLRNGKWDTTDRVALRIRTRAEVWNPDPKVREMLRCEQHRRDALRIVDLRTGEVLWEKEIPER